MPKDKPRVSDSSAKKRMGYRPANISRKQLEKEIDAHIEDLHCTLYGKAYDVSGEGNRPAAVEFFADFFESINARLG